MLDAIAFGRHRDIEPHRTASTLMRNAIDSSRVLVTFPVEVKAYLQERAKYHGGSFSAEVVRSARERMERDATRAMDRAATSGGA